MNYRTCEPWMRSEMLAQIGPRTLASISGGRVEHRDTGILLPVSNGYAVAVDLAANDTYTVRRMFRRGTKTWIKGERTEVYRDEVGNAAYYASCFRSYDAETWPTKSD